MRSKWRTKQNIDFSYLMMYAQSRGRYYCQMEDDVIAKPGTGIGCNYHLANCLYFPGHGNYYTQYFCMYVRRSICWMILVLILS